MEIREGVEEGWKMCRWRREDVMSGESAARVCGAEDGWRWVRTRLCMMSWRRRMEKVLDRSRRTTAWPFPPTGEPWNWLGRMVVAMMRYRS